MAVLTLKLADIEKHPQGHLVAEIPPVILRSAVVFTSRIPNLVSPSVYEQLFQVHDLVVERYGCPDWIHVISSDFQWPSRSSQFL